MVCWCNTSAKKAAGLTLKTSQPKKGEHKHRGAAKAIIAKAGDYYLVTTFYCKLVFCYYR